MSSPVYLTLAAGRWIMFIVYWHTSVGVQPVVFQMQLGGNS